MKSSLSKNASSFTKETEHDAESLAYIDEEGSESDVSGSRGSESDDGSEAQIAHKENQLVAYSKVLVVAVILVVAAVMGYLTHSYISNQEDDEFQRQFENVANDIIVSSEIRARGIFDNLGSVSISLTNQALALNMSWPMVTFPNFQVTAMVSNSITGAYSMYVSPIVKHEEREAYLGHSLRNQWWLDEGHMYDNEVAEDLYVEERFYDEPELESPFPLTPYNESGIFPFIWYPGQFGPSPVEDSEYYFPVSQLAPVEDFSPTANMDLKGIPESELYVNGVVALQKPVLAVTTRLTFLQNSYDRRFSRIGDAIPNTYIYQPIFDGFKKDRKLVGILAVFLPWDRFFMDILPPSEQALYVVLDGTCDDQQFTFKIYGMTVDFVGDGDLHDKKFSDMEQIYEFAPFSRLEPVEGAKSCAYTTRIYPTSEYSEQFFTSKPFTFTAAVVGCFLLTTLVFVAYDIVVGIRQKKVMETATKTNAIVSNLFPSNVRDRLMEELNPSTKKPLTRSNWKANQSIDQSESNADMSCSNTNIDYTEVDGSSKGIDMCATSEKIFGSKPIADLFPSATIMFADMVGFTAWSSVRDPTQVFTLLETVYHAFDIIAKRRRVFKVETIGDCYVACAGLPTARKNHALVMARYANEILYKMKDIVQNLETILGPDTADLCMRIGLHSGPVTAGVLRGEKGRFQLFGDSMNTAARMESNGKPMKVHISKETAECLQKGGRGNWVVEREDKVHAKGKGELQTYWLEINAQTRRSSSTLETGSETSQALSMQEAMDSEIEFSDTRRSLLEATGYFLGGYNAKMERLVQWNVEILASLLRQVMARRISRPKNFEVAKLQEQARVFTSGGKILNEVVDSLSLPQFDEALFKNHVDPSTIQMPPQAMGQLVEFIRKIASMYQANSFHNFEHASHVTMSVNKLLSRIINPNEIKKRHKAPELQVASDLHDHTYGITSDPLTHFAVVFSALIHDVNHPGVSNATLVKEQDPLAIKYENRSVAEQHSVDMAWNLLMSPEYKDLQNCIWENQNEYGRFRQLIVNIVAATDIMDKDLKALRNTRWEKAFNGGEASEDTSNVSVVNGKATIVLEHLIQASDVSHTMQHWHVFRKWNERLFFEMYQAFIDGRIDNDPSEYWYKGEIGFFDFYVIPLAKKLETCGVFGVSSDEYLAYAEANRQEWIEKGEDIVKEYMRKVEQATKVSGETGTASFGGYARIVEC